MGQRLGNGKAQFLSDVLVVDSMHIEFMPWLLSESRWSVSRSVERIRR